MDADAGLMSCDYDKRHRCDRSETEDREYR